MKRYGTVNLRQLSRCGITLTEEVLTLGFQGSNLLVKFGFLQKVGVARKHCHIFREVHTAVLVHRPFINGTATKRVCLQLVDEKLLIMQQVELVTVQ